MCPWIDTTRDRGVVSVDWFQLSTELASERDGKPLQAPAGWKCMLLSPTAVWGERWFVLDSDGNKVATILCSPRSSKIPCKAANVEIANRWLYYDDFRQICDRVLSILPMAIRGVRRVDLCCDFEMSRERYDTLQKLNSGQAYVKGYQQSNVWRQRLGRKYDPDAERSSVVPHDYNVGSPQSAFKWKVYYKWLELKQAPPEGKKPYIVDLWRHMGFNERYVWRCEVSVSDCNQLCGLDGNRLAPFDWYDNRTQLFCDIYSDKFQVRLDEGHKDRRNDKILSFLEVNGGKSIKFALPRSSRDDSDPERRISCKLWKELNEGDTACNPRLASMLRQNLMELLERPANLYAIQNQYGVDVQHIVSVLEGQDMPVLNAQ